MSEKASGQRGGWRSRLLVVSEWNPTVENILESGMGEGETVRVLLERRGFRLEQIVSRGRPSPAGFWYDQETEEWVMLVRGEAVLSFDPGGELVMRTGDFLTIPARLRHRVERVSSDAVWLAGHFSGEVAPD